MRFAHPWLLSALLLIPALAVYARRFAARGRARFRFSSLTLLPAAAKGHDAERALSYMRLAALTLLIIALARPQHGQSRQETLTPTTDILLVVDTSDSMNALDFKPKNRLEGAKDVLRTFIADRPDDRLGLVVFAEMAFTQCPLTLDHGALQLFLDRVHIGMIPENRTAIGSALAVAAARLKTSDAKSKTIILLTDGRNNAGDVDPVTAAKAAAALGIKIYTVGAGRPGGSEFPVDDPVFGRRLVHIDEDLDEDTLRAVAAATGGKYFRAADLDGLKKIYAEIDRLEKTDVKTETYDDYRDVYFPWLLAAVLLFLTEFTLTHTMFRRIP